MSDSRPGRRALFLRHGESAHNAHTGTEQLSDEEGDLLTERLCSGTARNGFSDDQHLHAIHSLQGSLVSSLHILDEHQASCARQEDGNHGGDHTTFGHFSPPTRSS